MPRPSRVCSTIDCNRTHHAKGFCRRCYGEHARKAAKRERSASRLSESVIGGVYADGHRFDVKTQTWGEAS